MPLMETLYQLERAKKVRTRPAFYSAQFLNNVVAAGTTTAPVNVNINSDSDFICRYMTCTVYNSPNIVVFTGLAALTVNLYDAGSGRNLMDNPLAIQNVMGGAGGTAGGPGGLLPFIWPEPWLQVAAGTIQVTLTNLGTLTFPRVEVAFTGIRVWPYTGTGSVASYFD